MNTNLNTYDPEYDEDYTSPFYQEVLKRGQEINQALKTGEGLISFKSTEEFSNWLDKLVEEDEDYNSPFYKEFLKRKNEETVFVGDFDDYLLRCRKIEEEVKSEELNIINF
jgi:hypothetical protein